MLFTLLPHSFSREWSAMLWGNSSSWPRAGAQLGQRGQGHTTPFPARASHLTKAIPAEVGRLGRALAPALGSSGLRSLAARRWCCADPCEPVDMILGMPVTGQGGCVGRESWRPCPPAYAGPGGTAVGSSASLPPGCSHPGTENTVPTGARRPTMVPVPFLPNLGRKRN